MIASILKLNGPVNEDLFNRFIASTSGVVASYLLEDPNDAHGTTVFTVWHDEESRDDYMASGLKDEVDRAYAHQSRSVFRVRIAKR